MSTHDMNWSDTVFGLKLKKGVYCGCARHYPMEKNEDGSYSGKIVLDLYFDPEDAVKSPLVDTEMQLVGVSYHISADEAKGKTPKEIFVMTKGRIHLAIYQLAEFLRNGGYLEPHRLSDDEVLKQICDDVGDEI